MWVGILNVPGENSVSLPAFDGAIIDTPPVTPQVAAQSLFVPEAVEVTDKNKWLGVGMFIGFLRLIVSIAK